MKINAGDLAGVNQVDLNQTRGVRDVGAAPSTDSVTRSNAPGGDSITLSATSDLVRLTMSAGSNDRAARLSELQKQVESGQYQVDSWAVSRALIDAHLAGE